MGIGETASDALTLPPELVVRVGDLRDTVSLRRKLFALHEHKRAALADLLRALPHDADRALYDDPSLLDRYLDALPRFTDRVAITDEHYVSALLERPGALLFEGAQGVLLDEWRGFHPYTTWSTCTPHNALALLADYDAPVYRIGVLRAYATRHGAGPFPTEDDTLKAALAESHNVTDPWQGRFRVGHFDVPLARYAIEACEGIDHLAITCLDRVAETPTWQLAHQHHAPNGNVAVTLPLTPHGDLDALASLTDTVSALQPQYETTSTTGDAEAHLRAIEAHLGPVTLSSYGRTAGDKRWRHPMAQPGRLL